jgi:hypothetical protein
MRFAQIEPQMLPEKFLTHDTDFAIPGKVSFWVRYEVKTCDNPNVVVEQETRIITGFSPDDEPEYQVREILEGDLDTLFMSDLGVQTAPFFGITSPGSEGSMALPGTNRSVVHTVYHTTQSMYEGDMRNSGDPLYRNYARNCFKVIVPDVVGGSEEKPYLTKDEWEALDEYRIVFRSIGTDPGLVDDDAKVAQKGVHIFSGSSAVGFQELDCVPFVYSPLLHLLPYGVIGGFAYDDEVLFKTYDFKTYYHDQIGLIIPEESQGSAQISSPGGLGVCDVKSQIAPGDMPKYEIIAVAVDDKPPPGELGSSLPFPIIRTFPIAFQTFSIEMPSIKHEFIYDAELTCAEFYGGECDPDDFFCFCRVEEVCHGIKTAPAYAGYTGFGIEDAIRHGERSVADHPLRNRLFVQGIKRKTSGDKFVAACFSEPGSTDFEGNNYQVFTGGEANAILNDMFPGDFNFGSPIVNPDLPDPNAPGCDGLTDIPYALNFTNEFTQVCGCAPVTCNFINYGIIDTPNTPSGVKGGQLFLKTPGIRFIGNDGLVLFDDLDINPNLGEDRIYGQPQLTFP